MILTCAPVGVLLGLHVGITVAVCEICGLSSTGSEMSFSLKNYVKKDGYVIVPVVVGDGLFERTG